MSGSKLPPPQRTFDELADAIRKMRDEARARVATDLGAPQVTAPINLAAVRVMRCNLRKDGWPLCRHCGDDEVAIIDSKFDALAVKWKPICPPIAELMHFDWFCYRCAAEVWRGSFRVVASTVTIAGELTVKYVPA